MALEFVQIYPCFKTKQAAVPQKSTPVHKALGSSEIGFFSETQYVIPVVFNVSVARFGFGGYDTKRYQCIGLRPLNGLVNGCGIGGFVVNDVVRGGNEQHVFRLSCQSGKSDGGGGIAGLGFDDLEVIENSGSRQICLAQVVIIFVSDHHDRIRHSLVSFGCELNQRLAVKHRDVLLRARFARKRPKPAPYSSR